MATHREVRIIHGGRSFSATYTVTDGVVSVASAYGSGTAKVGKRDPDVVAEKLLKGLAVEWCKRG